MLLCEYIDIIKRKYIKKRSSKYLEDIVVYTHKTEVYKVVIRYSELLIKQLHTQISKVVSGEDFTVSTNSL